VSYLFSYPDVVLRLLGQHVVMTIVALLISVTLALLFSLLVFRYERFGTLLLGVLGALYTIPSIALIIILVPIFGLNARSVIVALVIYTQAILVRNFVAGLKAIDPAILEAAQGMGMNGWQLWSRVQLPLALPVMLAGVRIALVVAVAVATLGAKFGAGGLGRLLFDGVTQAGRYDKIWAGAISVSLLAMLFNRGLMALENAFALESRVRRAERRQDSACGSVAP